MVLLCPSGTGLKYEKAQEWGVPVVGLEWLKEMATTGRIPEVEKHVVKMCASSVQMCVIGDVAKNEEDGRVVDEKVVEKGKGKATSVETDDAIGMDVDHQMHDVTASELPPCSQWDNRRTQGNFSFRSCRSGSGTSGHHYYTQPRTSRKTAFYGWLPKRDDRRKDHVLVSGRATAVFFPTSNCDSNPTSVNGHDPARGDNRRRVDHNVVGWSTSRFSAYVLFT